MSTLPTPEQLQDIAERRVQNLAATLASFEKQISAADRIVTSITKSALTMKRVAASVASISEGDEPALKEGLNLLKETREVCFKAGDKLTSLSSRVRSPGERLKYWAQHDGVFVLEKIANEAGWDEFTEADFQTNSD